MDGNNGHDVGDINVVVPFPGSVSPDLDRARSRHLKWVANLALWSSPSVQAAYEAADYPLFVAQTYPSAQGPDLDLAIDLHGCSWLLDDSFDEPGIRQASPKDTAARLNTYRNLLYGRPTQTPDTPLVIAWRELLDRLHERTSEIWRQRHSAHWEDMFMAFQLEAKNNSRGHIPSLDEYFPLRRAASGVEIVIDWIEALGRFELPANLHIEPIVLALREDTADVVMMTNDLFSARNEWNGGNTDNILHALANQEKCSWCHASEITHNIIASTIERFQRNETEFYNSSRYTTLQPQDQANTRQFIEGMKHFMRGSLDWHYNTPRYR